MSLFERMERKLERTVNGVFARAFRAEVQPLELASALRRAMDDRATMLGRGRTIVPNLFTVELAPSDYERLTEFDQELEDELVAAAQEHCESQRYQPGGPLQVLFDQDDELETGVFRVRPATARQRVERAEQVRAYSDEQARTDLYRQVQEGLAQDPNAIYLTFLDHTYVTNPHGYDTGSLVVEPHAHGVGWGPWWNVGQWT